MVKKKKSPAEKPVKAESKAAKTKRTKSETVVESPVATQTEPAPLPEECSKPVEERDLIEDEDYTIEDLLDAIAARNSAESEAPEPDIEEIDDEETARLESVLDRIDRILAAGGIRDIDEYGRKLDEELAEANLQHELHELAIDEMLEEE